MLRRTVAMGGLALVMVASMAQAQDARQFRGGFGGPGGFAGNSAMLLGMPEVQKELGVSDEQKGLIEDMVADLRQQMQGSFNFQEFQSLSPEERQKRGEEARKKGEEITKKTDEMVGMILEAKQAERLSQLRLQREGVGALNRPDVAEKLKITDEQKEKMGKIREALFDRSAFANFANMSDEERREAGAKMREKGEKANADILALLTADQKESWTKMQGKKFDFPPPQGFGGRPGGDNRRPDAKKKDDK